MKKRIMKKRVLLTSLFLVAGAVFFLASGFSDEKPIEPTNHLNSKQTITTFEKFSSKEKPNQK